MKDIYVLKYKSGNHYLTRSVNDNNTRFQIIGYTQIGLPTCLMSIGHHIKTGLDTLLKIEKERATEEQISQATLNAL